MHFKKYNKIKIKKIHLCFTYLWFRILSLNKIFNVDIFVCLHTFFLSVSLLIFDSLLCCCLFTEYLCCSFVSFFFFDSISYSYYI